MEQKRFGCFSIGLIIVLCLSLFLNFIVVVYGLSRAGSSMSIRQQPAPKFEEATVVAGAGKTTDKIIVISLRGVITSSLGGDLGETMVDDLKIAFRQATDDKHVKAIVFRVDSPGGEVTASDEIYTAVREAREKKPVVVCMDSVAASGGYYVSCGGSYLIANETTITGSIGVIIETLSYYQLLGKVGVETVVFKSGKFKDTLNGGRPMTPEEKEYIQALVMQTYDKFLGIVASERKLPADELRNGIADGRIVSGKDAKTSKLIDEVGHIEQAYEKAKDLGHAPGAAIIRYEAPFHLGRLFRLVGQAEPPKVEVLPKQFVPKLEPGRLYMLPSFYAP
jgi:protease IV